jgi:hypothetical protein
MKPKNAISVAMSVIPVAAMLALSLSFEACHEDVIKSDKKDILSFVLAGQNDTAVIDHTAKTVAITMKYDADLTNLNPQITISEKATIDPASGETVDFSGGPVVYKVTAEDNSTQNWTVTVTRADEMEKKILSFVLKEQKGDAVIDYVNDSVNVTVGSEADMTKLKPTITVSAGTTISPASEAETDFSKGPVTYTITATDGSQKEWYVKVTRILYYGNNILSVSIPGQTGTTGNGPKQLVVFLPSGTNFTSLTPTFTLSPGATIDPPSGEPADFSMGPVTYTVTAENGKTSVWGVLATLPLIAADDSHIQYVGRVDFKTPSAPRMANPGIYFTTKFTGTFCDIEINDESSSNYIEVVVDDQAPVRILLTQGKKVYRVVSGLSAGEHTLLICKDTEAAVQGLVFYGIRCEGSLSSVDLPARKMEFYGNSITAGACMLLDYCSLYSSNWQAANGAYLSYGPLTARALNAQWHITAVSGIGLIQSCCGMTNEMPDTYDRLDLNNNSAKWDFSKYIPDVVTISLGQNDGSTIVASKEFKDAYVAFINTLRSKYPDATIFCLTSPMADDGLFVTMKTALASVVDSVNTAGDAKVFWVELPHNMRDGCSQNPHPSAAQHETIAATLEAAVREKMGW